MKIKKVILTLPHSICNGNSTDDRSIQMCDLNSENFAQKLYNKLIENNINTVIIKSNNNRTELDDNRYKKDIDEPNLIDLSKYPPIFKQTTFNETSQLWINLRKETKKYYEENNNSFDGLLILDCHSFPEKSHPNLDFYLIDYKQINNQYSYLGQIIYNYFNENTEYNHTIKQGKINFNSIIEMSQISNIPCVLVEILEEIDETKLNDIISHFVKIIIQFELENIIIKKLSLYFNYIVTPINQLFGYPNIITKHKNNVIMAIHCGYTNDNYYKLSPEIKENITTILSTAYKNYKINNSLELVYNAILNMEDTPYYNAGLGSVTTSNGTIEKEAILIDGNGEVGSASLIPGGFSPLKISKCLIEKNNNQIIKLSGTGATDYYMNNCMKGGTYLDFNELYGTIGCVCIDKQNKLAASSSTGGMLNKLPGIIGDSGIIGHGTYANNNTCAISCSGIGEYFSKEVAAYQIHLRYKQGYSLQNSVKYVLNRVNVIGGDGGIIALTKYNELVVSNTKMGKLIYGYLTTDGNIYIST